MLLFQFLLLYFLFIFMRNLVFPQPENKQWNTVEDVVLIPILLYLIIWPQARHSAIPSLRRLT